MSRRSSELFCLFRSDYIYIMFEDGQKINSFETLSDSLVHFFLVHTINESRLNLVGRCECFLTKVTPGKTSNWTDSKDHYNLLYIKKESRQT